MAEGGWPSWLPRFLKTRSHKKREHQSIKQNEENRNTRPKSNEIDKGLVGSRDGNSDDKVSNEGNSEIFHFIQNDSELKEVEILRSQRSRFLESNPPPPKPERTRSVEAELQNLRKGDPNKRKSNNPMSTTIYRKRAESASKDVDASQESKEDWVETYLRNYGQGSEDKILDSNAKLKMASVMPGVLNLFPREGKRTVIKDLPVKELLELGKTRKLDLHDEDALELRNRFLNMLKQQKREIYFCGEGYIIPAEIDNWQVMGEKMIENGELLSAKLTSPEQVNLAQRINKKVAIWKGDIASLEVDAVVNSASSFLLDERSGVSKHLSNSAGELLDYELRKIWLTTVGEVVSTAGYCLPAKYILHTSGPLLSWEDWDEAIENCYKNSLDKIRELKIKTLAFCCIATGAKGLNNKKAAKIALKTTHDWLELNHEYVDKIVFCIYEPFQMDIYEAMIKKVFPVVPGSHEKDTHLPPEILRMDSRSKELYLKALGEGKTKVHNIRVMVVGHFDVGKTTLTKRLLGEKVNIRDRDSTDGIEVHEKRCRVDMETGEWDVKSKGLHRDDSSTRLAKVVQQFSVTSSNDDSLEIPDTCIGRLDISDTDSSLDSTNNTGNFVATPDSLDEPDAKPVVSFDEEPGNSNIIFEGAGASMNESLSQKDTPVMDDLKLLVQRDDGEDLSDIDKFADLSIWDFAGQYAFYGTHQIFLSPRSVYLLVIDLSKTIDSLVCDDTFSDGENRMKILEFVEFWLQSIHFYTEKKGMVILVGTHADKLPQEGLGENVDKIFQSLRDHLCDKPYRFCLSEYEFYIDNSKVDPTLKRLKEAIFNVAKSNTNHWGELKPANWLTLERQLQVKRQRGVKIIKRDNLEAVNRNLCVSLPGDQLDLFLRFQHACGLVLYFSEQELEEYVILDPQWLIDAFKCFITADMFVKKSMSLLPLWKKFKNTAILTQEFIDSSWNRGKDNVFFEHKKHLLQLLEKLHIIAKPVTFREHEITDSKVSWFSEGNYFTPCMLKEKTHRSLLDTAHIPNSKSTHRLCYTFVSGLDWQASGFVPPAIFHRLLAACMSMWQPRESKLRKETKTLLFCDSGVFNLDPSRTHSLTLYLRDNFIQIWITSYSGEQPSYDICMDARDKLECFLKKLCSSCSKMDMNTYIKCPRTDCCSSDGMIKCSVLSNYSKYCCPEHEEGSSDYNHQIISSDVLQNWTVVDIPKQDGPCLNRKPTDNEIATMALRIGVEWQQLGSFLNLSKSCMEQIKMDYPNSSADRIRIMLMEWRKKFAQEGTFRKLEAALKDADCDVNFIFENFSY